MLPADRIYICQGQSKLSLSPPVPAAAAASKISRAQVQRTKARTVRSLLSHLSHRMQCGELFVSAFQCFHTSVACACPGFGCDDHLDDDAHALHACIHAVSTKREIPTVMAVLHVWLLFCPAVFQLLQRTMRLLLEDELMESHFRSV